MTFPTAYNEYSFYEYAASSDITSGACSGSGVPNGVLNRPISGSAFTMSAIVIPLSSIRYHEVSGGALNEANLGNRNMGEDGV